MVELLNTQVAETETAIFRRVFLACKCSLSEVTLKRFKISSFQERVPHPRWKPVIGSDATLSIQRFESVTGEKPFFEHLEDLRWTLIKSVRLSSLYLRRQSGSCCDSSMTSCFGRCITSRLQIPRSVSNCEPRASSRSLSKFAVWAESFWPLRFGFSSLVNFAPRRSTNASGSACLRRGHDAISPRLTLYFFC